MPLGCCKGSQVDPVVPAASAAHGGPGPLPLFTQSAGILNQRTYLFGTILNKNTSYNAKATQPWCVPRTDGREDVRADSAGRVVLLLAAAEFCGGGFMAFLQGQRVRPTGLGHHRNAWEQGWYHSHPLVPGHPAGDLRTDVPDAQGALGSV